MADLIIFKSHNYKFWLFYPIYSYCRHIYENCHYILSLGNSDVFSIRRNLNNFDVFAKQKKRAIKRIFGKRERVNRYLHLLLKGL